MGFRGILLIAGVIGFCFGASYATPASAANAYDGDWITKAITKSGNCRPAYKFVVSVREGAVSGATEGNLGKFTISGQVKESGQIQMKIEGRDTIEASGKLSGNEGSGNWESVRGCAGEMQWRRK